jgi:hypothetical protein
MVALVVCASSHAALGRPGSAEDRIGIARLLASDAAGRLLALAADRARGDHEGAHWCLQRPPVSSAPCATRRGTPSNRRSIRLLVETGAVSSSLQMKDVLNPPSAGAVRPIRRIIRNSALALLLAVILLPFRWWAATIAVAIACAYVVGQLMFTRTCVACAGVFRPAMAKDCPLHLVRSRGQLSVAVTTGVWTGGSLCYREPPRLERRR